MSGAVGEGIWGTKWGWKIGTDKLRMYLTKLVKNETVEFIRLGAIQHPLAHCVFTFFPKDDHLTAVKHVLPKTRYLNKSRLLYKTLSLHFCYVVLDLKINFENVRYINIQI